MLHPVRFLAIASAILRCVSGSAVYKWTDTHQDEAAAFASQLRRLLTFCTDEVTDMYRVHIASHGSNQK